MSKWLTQTDLFGNPIQLWLIAAAGALIGYLVVHSTLAFAASKLRERQERSPNRARAVVIALLKATRRWLVFLLALVLAGRTLEATPRLEALLQHMTFALLGLQMALLANGLIALWLRDAPADPLRRSINPVLAGMLSWAAQLLVWAVLLLFFLSNVGVNVNAFVASLGIGGVAVALALQNILGDLFASAAIGLDKPFEVGQVIAFGQELGTVLHVGVKTTRVRSLSGEELAISNTDLLKQVIHNHSRRSERRIVFGFKVPYGTPRAQVEEIPRRVRSFFEQEEKVRFDRGHFSNFGEHGPEFEFVYIVLDPDYTLYMDIQQRINLRIMELLDELGAEIAIPVRQIRVVSAPGAGTGSANPPAVLAPQGAAPASAPTATTAAALLGVAAVAAAADGV
jgi:small-conductance mechanosensitive channel